MRKWPAVALVATLAACSDSTGPRSGVSQTWLVAYTNFSGGGLTCHADQPGDGRLGLTLNQSGSTLSGTHTGLLMSCTMNGEPMVEWFPPGFVVNGTSSGTSVSFDLDRPISHYAGSVNGNVMSGTGSQEVFSTTSPSDSATLSGSWTAAKQ